MFHLLQSLYFYLSLSNSLRTSIKLSLQTIIGLKIFCSNIYQHFPVLFERLANHMKFLFQNSQVLFKHPSYLSCSFRTLSIVNVKWDVKCPRLGSRIQLFNDSLEIRCLKDNWSCRSHHCLSSIQTSIQYLVKCSIFYRASIFLVESFNFISNTYQTSCVPFDSLWSTSCSIRTPIKLLGFSSKQLLYSVWTSTKLVLSSSNYYGAHVMHLFIQTSQVPFKHPSNLSCSFRTLPIVWIYLW